MKCQKPIFLAILTVLNIMEKMNNYSPLLSIITCLFEFTAAVFAFRSTGRKRILHPTGMILILLGCYQLMEVVVCLGPEQPFFTRFAFMIITWLPPAGIWLTFALTEPPLKGLKYAAFTYGTASLGMTLWVAIDPSSVTKTVCEIVIARYASPNPFDTLYGIFYQSGLAVIIFGAAAALAYAGDSTLRKHLVSVQTGILGFVLPSLAIRLLFPAMSGELPSVMCHFALLLAVSLFFLIRRERRTTTS